MEMAWLIYLGIVLFLFLTRHPFTMVGYIPNHNVTRVILSLIVALIALMLLSLAVDISLLFILPATVFLIDTARFMFRPIMRLDRFLHEREK